MQTLLLSGDIQRMDQDLGHLIQHVDHESDETGGDSDSSSDSSDYDLYEAPNTNGEVSKW